MERKLKVYLDTSVISYLQQEENQIIDMEILTPKSMDDCQHIATAVVHGCDCILSWNFKHIVNIKTIKGVRAITHLESYKDIDIMNPSVLLGCGES